MSVFLHGPTGMLTCPNVWSIVHIRPCLLSCLLLPCHLPARSKCRLAQDPGHVQPVCRNIDLPQCVEHIHYYAGWADKIHGKVIPVNGEMMAYTYKEPIGVVGQIIPW